MNVCLDGKYIIDRGLLMNNIITKIHNLIKNTDNLIAFEESIKHLMEETFTKLVSDAFVHMNEPTKEKAQKDNHKVVRNHEKRTIDFSFGAVTYYRTSFKHKQTNENFYPLDNLLGIRPNQRYSPFVEVKAAELASESDYREVARILEEWTPVTISHTTIGEIVKRVGQAQAEADKLLVDELDIADYLPEGKQVNFLYAEADGVFVRGTNKKKHHEVYHGITYEGWAKNGERVSLVNPRVMLTTQGVNDFWKEVQASTTFKYSLENTQIITNSDGGPGYAAERFEEAFSQSHHTVLNQLDDYHIKQAINRAFGWNKSEFKNNIQSAITNKDKDTFVLWTDTFESTLEKQKEIKKLSVFRTYILNHWDRIFDWRKIIKNAPKDARSLGCIESRQRYISFRMKKRGMHWSLVGAEAMVKVKQGILNGTLREVYLEQQKRSKRKQREITKTVHKSHYFKQIKHANNSRQGSISLYSAHSSAVGRLLKSIT